MKSKLEKLVSTLTEKLHGPLPGNASHVKLMPESRKKYPSPPDLNGAKASSVLLLFYPDGDRVMLVFIQRPVYNGVHSGQIAFPGGGFESEDLNSIETALRETREEIGIPREKITILGKLTPLYIPPSNFLVDPYVGYMDEIPQFVPDPEEVHEIFALNISDLLHQDCVQIREVSGTGYRFEVPCFFIENRLIWGATSMILSELLDIIRN